MQRQNTIKNDPITNLETAASKGVESNDPNDYGVCLLRDSPYRILRVSKYSFFFHDTFDMRPVSHHLPHANFSSKKKKKHALKHFARQTIQKEHFLSFNFFWFYFFILC